MKRLFYIICFLLVTSFALGEGIKLKGIGIIQQQHLMILAKKNACTIGDPDATGKYETNSTSTDLISDAKGQSFEVGANGRIAQICVNIDHVSDDTFDLRFDTEVDMSNGVVEDFGTSATITGAGWVCFESATNPWVSTLTTYYIGLLGDSGKLTWYHNAVGGYASGSGIVEGSGWNISGGNGTRDYNFRVYLCE